jgi:cytidylate kinase
MEAIREVDDEQRSAPERLLSKLGRAGTVTIAGGERTDQLDLEERRLRSYIEDFVVRASESGCVVLGRGGMVILGSIPTALHVQLQGPRLARVEQAMRLESIDRRTAERRRRAEDAARIGYVRRSYRVDGADPSLYHLILDSTELALEACVDLIVQASHARLKARPAPVDRR